MSRCMRVLGLGLVLLLAMALLVGVNTARAFDDEDKAIKDAQKDILDLAKEIEDGKDTAAKVKAMKKKYEDLAPIMHAYKPSTKKGLGVPGLPKGTGDGIEAKLLAMGKRALSPAALGKEKDGLIKMAYINAAIADVTMAYAPAKPKAGKGAKEWKGHTDDMKKSSLELAAALKGGDASKVKTAAANVNNACNNCHSDFRD